MRSEIYVAPNERLTCAGCHEPRWAAPPMMKQIPLAMRREPSTIQPGPDGSNPFNFVRLVQPVLNAKCVACHTEGDGKAAMALTTGTLNKQGWSESYANLQKVAFYYDSGSFTESKTIPGKFGALASRLYGMLNTTHHDLKLTPDEMSRITLWLDCNSDFYGTYENLPAQSRGEVVNPVLK